MNIMNSIDVDTARHRVLAILLATIGVLLTVGIALYFPARKIHRVNRDIAQVEADLASRQQKYASSSLTQQTALTEQRNQQLQQTWERLRLQIDTFHGNLPKRASVAVAEDARIDFKVALISDRQALQDMAKRRGVALTDNLGISETIGTGDVTETRLWELAAVVGLVELLISIDVEAVTAITSLPPFVYAQIPSENEITLAFPVRVALSCQYSQLKPLLEALCKQDSFYAIGLCDISRPSPESDTLHVVLECSALRFVVGTTSSAAEESTDATRRGEAPLRRRGALP